MNISQFYLYFYSCRGKASGIELWYQQNCLRLSLKQLKTIPENVVFTVEGRDYFRAKNKIVRVERTIWTVN